jgi:hypothetical protein
VAQSRGLSNLIRKILHDATEAPQTQAAA